ncbi:TerD family protein, partial [Kitasatospora sp. NPDC002227]|uniref:TerD family protein n=1 Tax=Kitasatospora sp. NPDC002227 TaxID=3154773 RepID=UPI00331EA515
MTHVMAKGANISLTAAAVRAVLCWQTGPGSPEVDASALLLGPDGRVRSDADFVFYNQPSHPSGLVRHQPGGQLPDGCAADVGGGGGPPRPPPRDQRGGARGGAGGA